MQEITYTLQFYFQHFYTERYMAILMTIQKFLTTVKESPNTIEFSTLMDLIEANYSFTETAFSNGDLHNEAGQNSGSCKLFSFAKLHQLDQAQTLVCFGEYYQKDVLENPEGDDHQNIRSFMRTGWDGIQFEGNAEVLSSKS